MITQEIYLPKYKWSVTVYYAVDSYYMDEILEELEKFNPTQKEYDDVRSLMESYEYNTGFTYSDLDNNKSLVVIGLTTSPEEFQDTFDHEKGHLAVHIAQKFDIDLYGEEFQYLVGSIGKKLFPVAKKFMCEHCRKELEINFFSVQI